MVASVFELRQGIDMPKSVSELYETASQSMLARGHVASDALVRLLQAVFFQGHVRQRRVIDDWQLDEAALGLEAPEVLETMRERLKRAIVFEPFDGRAELGHFVE